MPTIPLRDTLPNLLTARGEQSRSAKRLVSERSKCGREGGPFLTISENHKQQRDTTRLLSKQYSLAAPQTVKKTAAGTQQARYTTQLSNASRLCRALPAEGLEHERSASIQLRPRAKTKAAPEATRQLHLHQSEPTCHLRCRSCSPAVSTRPMG